MFALTMQTVFCLLQYLGAGLSHLSYFIWSGWRRTVFAPNLLSWVSKACLESLKQNPNKGV